MIGEVKSKKIKVLNKREKTISCERNIQGKDPLQGRGTRHLGNSKKHGGKMEEYGYTNTSW